MTDLTLAEALSEVGKWGRLVKGFEKVAEVVSALQGAEQSVAEKTAQAAQLAIQVDALRAQAAEASVVVAEAKSKAQAILAAANTSAADTLEAAESMARVSKSEADAAVQAAGLRVTEAQGQLASIKAEIGAAGKELEAIKTRTAAALEAARKTFGG